GEVRGPGFWFGIGGLCCRGIRGFVGFDAGQEPMEQIGDHQERMGDFQRGRLGQLHGEKLIERVELHELEAGGFENSLARDNRKRLVENADGATVAVVVRNSKQLVVFVQKTEIDAPGIDTDAGNLVRIELAGSAEAAGGMLPETHQRPMHVLSRMDAAVVETIDLFERQLLPIKKAGADPAAGGTEVDGEEDLGSVGHSKSLRGAGWRPAAGYACIMQEFFIGDIFESNSLTRHNLPLICRYADYAFYARVCISRPHRGERTSKSSCR